MLYFKFILRVSTIFIVLTPFYCYGQTFHRPSYDLIWQFGDNVIDFREEVPTFSGQDVGIVGREGISSIYNSTLNSMIVSNGARVLNGEGELLINGDSLSFNVSTFTEVNALGLPGPDPVICIPSLDQEGKTSILYLSFRRSNNPDTLNINTHLDHLLLSKVTDQSPYVSIKDSIVFSDTLDQGISAVRHGNGIDWWIILNSRKRNEQHILLYDSDGISLHQTEVFSPDNLFIGLGESVISPDGSFFAKIKVRYPDREAATIMVYEFDRCEGSLKKKEYIQTPDDFILSLHGIAFSPNNKFMYVNIGSTYLIQYDIYSTNISQSADTIFSIFDLSAEELAEGIGFWQMKLAPDGKIYIGTQGSFEHLHVLNRPNLRGDSCNFVYKGIQVSDFTPPALPSFPVYGVGPLDNSVCDTLGVSHPTPIAAFEYISNITSNLVEFFDASSNFATWHNWNFGDSNSSSERFPAHEFTEPGVYFVCLEVGTEQGSNTFCDSVEVGNYLSPVNVLTNHRETIYSIWPNPVTDNLFIRPTNQAGAEAEIIIYNSLGHKVKNSHLLLDGINILNLEDLPSGIYYLKILELNDSLGYLQKIIVH